MLLLFRLNQLFKDYSGQHLVHKLRFCESAFVKRYPQNYRTLSGNTYITVFHSSYIKHTI